MYMHTHSTLHFPYLIFSLKENDAHGNQCITRMIHFTENLRRLRLDTGKDHFAGSNCVFKGMYYKRIKNNNKKLLEFSVEYAALKVIILMSSGELIFKQ